MKNIIFKTEGLTKTYKNTDALHNVTISLEQGKIYGLIGQNGAGKTTLMRIASGLSFPTSGNILLFEQTNPKKIQTERKRMGCMIESPSLIPYLSAQENLKHYRILKGIPNVELEQEILELVGLQDTGKKKVRDFSMGMKQRLGISIALLGNPEFLILDEPVNGVDPVGIVDIRNLLLKLCDEKNMTILISSHNLPELYQTATDYIIIHKGIIKKNLTLAQLEECCKHHILIRCHDTDKLAVILETELNTSNFKVMPDHTVKLYDYVQNIDLVSEALARNNLIVSTLSVEGDTLEDYFLSLINE